MNRISRWSRRLLSLTLLGGLSVAGCHREQNAGGHQRPPPSVTVTTAAAADVPIYLDEIGRTVAFEYVSIQPQVAGQIEKLHFTDGSEIKKGDLLVNIDPRPFEAALSQAEANLGQQQAALELAQQELTRVQGLIETKAISQQEFDQRKNAVIINQAQVKAGEAAVRTARLNLEYCTIRSPIDGRAGKRLVDVGNIVKANEVSLLTIQRLDPMYVDFTVTERSLPDVRAQIAASKEPLQVEVRGPGQTSPARIGALSFLDNTVQTGAGTVTLRATLDNKDRYFWAGQFVEVRLILKTKKDAVLASSRAVQISQQGPFVFVVKSDGTAEQRKVKLGQRQGENMVIEEGVKPGDRVITTGQMFVMPGGKVNVLEGVAGL